MGERACILPRNIHEGVDVRALDAFRVAAVAFTALSFIINFTFPTLFSHHNARSFFNLIFAAEYQLSQPLHLTCLGSIVVVRNKLEDYGKLVILCEAPKPAFTVT